MNTSWIKDCEICNTGLCDQLQEYVDQGLSEREASRQMERDCGGLWSAEKIYGRFRYYVKGHAGGAVGKPHRNGFPSKEAFMKMTLVFKLTEGCSGRCPEVDVCREKLMGNSLEYLSLAFTLVTSDYQDEWERVKRMNAKRPAAAND
jgi:hypothetical protein